jgi:6-phosphofructokinase
MNTAVRAAVRFGLDKGHIMFGVRNGLQGLIDGDIQEMDWMSVNGWAQLGGSELGTNRKCWQRSSPSRNTEPQIEAIDHLMDWIRICLSHAAGTSKLSGIQYPNCASSGID